MATSVMVTGGTGYVGSWVVKALLQKGYDVRLTVRNKNKKEKYQHLQQIADQAEGTMTLWEADLLKEGSYDQAAKGCELVVHMASPFFLSFKDPQRDLIDPAVKGTKNVLNAATRSGTVKKVVLTSSVAAIHGDNIDLKEKGVKEFDESFFNTSSSPSHQPYSYSKVAAEKAAWELAEAQDQWKLVVINPSFVIGPSLTSASDSESLTLMKDILKGKFFLGAPALEMGFVDVRDVAQAHMLAIEKPEAEGRHLLAERTMSIMQLSRIIKEEFGGKYKLPLMESPKFMLYVVGGLFGVTNKFVSRNVGHPLRLNASKSKEKLGLKYRSMNATVRDMVTQMHSLKLV